MKRTESFFRATDLIRVGIVLLMISVVVIPWRIKHKEEKYWKDFYAKREAAEELSKKEYEEWKSMSNEEQFIWFVRDLDKENGSVRRIDVDQKTKSIYIYVLGAPLDKMPDMKGYIDYEIQMASIARECELDKEVYVVGASKTGKEYWAIDKNGSVIDFEIEKGDSDVKL